ncbi:MAG: PilT/PilU family type 4a pilus ATPase [Oscillospiraceae bacterium]
MDAIHLLREAVDQGASDIFVIVGLPFTYKIDGVMVHHQDSVCLISSDCETFVREIYAMAHRAIEPLLENGDDDFSFAIKGISRFRANIYRQRGTLAAVIRVVLFELPDPVRLGIPEEVLALASCQKGLVLVTGPAGSGKTTTLACIIDRINQTRSAHVITLEDPIEYLHRHNKSIVSQREISTDTVSYVTALRAAMRQAPDVILLGEMRDFETISVAMTAAETGHLVISTLHTVGAANAIDRIVDAFPPAQQGQARVQLAQILQAVVSQQLLPREQGGEEPVFEIMLANTAIRNMIRESKIHQIETAMYSDQRMRTMDNSLLALFKAKVISEKTALLYSLSPDALSRRLKG